MFQRNENRFCGSKWSVIENNFFTCGSIWPNMYKVSNLVVHLLANIFYVSSYGNVIMIMFANSEHYIRRAKSQIQLLFWFKCRVDH